MMKALTIILTFAFMQTTMFSNDLFENNQNHKNRITSFTKKDGTIIQFNDVKTSLQQLEPNKNRIKNTKIKNTAPKYLFHRLNNKVYESYDMRTWMPYSSLKQAETSSNFANNENIKISPNPVYDILNIDVIYGQYFEIYSILGLKVMDGNCFGKIDVNILPSGIYVIQANGVFSKFIKM